VVEVKNGFQDKEGKPFDPADYADIKIILLVGTDPHYQFEELVEIQIIQRVNLDLKKTSHRVYDFEREEEAFLAKAEENQKIAQKFLLAVSSFDKEAAEHLSNSEYTSFKTVAQAL